YDNQLNLLYQINWVNTNGSSQLGQAFTQLKHKISENLSLNAGFHYMYYFLSNKNSLEPRAGLQWEFIPNQSISLGYGRHSKLLPSGVYFGEVIDKFGNITTPNTSLDFVRADHYVLGYDISFSDDLRLKVETYYQFLKSAPVLADTATSFSGLNLGADYENLVSREPLSNSGTGENYGIEMTLERFLSRGYYFLLTASLYESKYQGSDNIVRNTVFDGKYAWNLLGGKEFTVGKDRNNIIGINATIVNIGGKRYTPIDIESSKLEGSTVRFEELAFSERLDDYFRVDFRISYRQNKKKYSHEIAFEAKNMFNNKNIFLQYYDDQIEEVVTLYQMGLFPIALYRIEF
ncbi:MAG: TonB-dependent receptor, partial [Bacteroidetes bacterium]|nr:TonB-dependent receptor [Bacteroidota bacterium]